MGLIVNRHELAEIIGVADRTITVWQTKGMPMEVDGGRGKRNSYDTGKVIQWLIATKSGSEEEGYDLTKEKARLAAHQADKAEIEVKVRRNELLSADDVGRVWGNQVTSAKTRLLAIPSKAAPMVIAADSAGEAQDILDNMVREALQEIANDYVPESSQDSEDGGVDTTA